MFVCCDCLFNMTKITEFSDNTNMYWTNYGKLLSHLHIKAVYSTHISKILYNINTITTFNTVSMTIIFIKRHDKNILRI